MLIQVLRFALPGALVFALAGCLSVSELSSLGTPGPTMASPLRADAPTHFICWNVHKADDESFRKEVGELLEEVPREDGVMLCFQEVRSSTFDLIKDLHREDVSGHYAPSWRFPFADRSTGVLTIGNQSLPKSGALSIPSPKREFYVASPKVSLKTAMPLADGRELKIINCHGLNFVPFSALPEQLEGIFRELEACDSPAIVCGDFNVWSPRRLELLNEQAEAVGLVEAKPRGDEHFAAPKWLRWMGGINGYDPEIRLDRIYTRGIEVLDCRFHETPKSSDHLPLIFRYKVLPNRS